MRVAWLTPLSKRTGISRYSVSAVKALSARIDMDVWTTSNADNFPLEGTPVYEISLDENTFARLRGYDLVIYNMGNNIDFHYEIYEVYKHIKGLVVIHDRIMHHFFSGCYLDRVNDPDTYSSTMRFYYGSEGRKSAERSLSLFPPVWQTDEVARYPMLEILLWNAYGAVVHSRDLFQHLSIASTIPVRNIPHPFYVYTHDQIPVSKKDLNIPDDKTIILQYGHITPNKNVHKVIETISESPGLLDTVFFIIAGDNETTYGSKVKKMVQEKGLQSTVLLTGYISDALLHDYISSADICINLRFPATEGSSGSLIEQLFFRKPVIATDIGFFAEVPDDCILKVAPPIEKNELSEAISLLVKDTYMREKMAASGNEFAMKNFSPDHYAKCFVKFISEVLSSKPAIDLIDTVADEISNFVSPQKSEGFIDGISSELETITGSKGIEQQDNASENTDVLSYGYMESAVDRGYANGSLPYSLKEKFLGYAWKHRNSIKKIPLLNTMTKKVYHAIFDK